MKTKFFLFAVTAAFGFAIVACDDDDDDAVVTPDTTQNKTEMITGKDWVMTSAIETSDGQMTDVLASIPLTSQDDVFKFNVNGEAVREEGKTKADGDDPQIVETAPWSFIDEERRLKVDFISLPTEDEIVEISPKRIILKEVGPESTTLTTFEVAE